MCALPSPSSVSTPAGFRNLAALLASGTWSWPRAPGARRRHPPQTELAALQCLHGSRRSLLSTDPVVADVLRELRAQALGIEAELGGRVLVDTARVGAVPVDPCAHGLEHRGLEVEPDEVVDTAPPSRSTRRRTRRGGRRGTGARRAVRAPPSPAASRSPGGARGTDRARPRRSARPSPWDRATARGCTTTPAPRRGPGGSRRTGRRDTHRTRRRDGTRSGAP